MLVNPVPARCCVVIRIFLLATESFLKNTECFALWVEGAVMQVLPSCYFSRLSPELFLFSTFHYMQVRVLFFGCFFSAVVLLHSFHLLNGLLITTPGITVCVTDNVPGQTRALFTTQVNPIAAAPTPDGLNGRLCNSK